MKLSAGIKRTGLSLVLAVVGLVLFLILKSPLSWIGFILLFLGGTIFSSRSFERNASRAEKKEDLEERKRNGLG